MKLARFGILVLGVALASGCTSRMEVAEGSFEYLEIEERSALIIPEGLEERPQRSQFAIPEKTPGMDGAPKGRFINIRSPRQVLTLAPGSRVDDASQASAISFDSVEGVANLPGWVWAEVERSLEGLGATAIESETERRIVTDRFRIEQYRVPRRGFFNRIRGSRVIVESEQSYVIDMTVPAHRRSATLAVEVADIRWIVDGSVVPSNEMPAQIRRDLEVDLLNTISSNLNQRYMQGRVASAQEAIDIVVGTTSDGQAAFQFDADFNTAWVVFPGVLRELGFEIDDLNQSEGMYYTEYQPGGRRGWIRRIFSRGEQGPLDIPRGTDVTFSVDSVDGVASIVPTINNEPISRERLESWLPAMQNAFRDSDN
ncbi:outer membrane protein assembly factor BamC [Aliidiomarina sanyensis]|uniref:Outer membrane protein assembly factor BamC n=1 Tax=Aliidiomarina sanyensis TaxID=1249555 RepID=A0A432WN14_9GAMM|nr:outer membrane protein assembly factor BamC [Aliidiomarina sanyensis]RUO35192.1 hypothetical protein CWE11_03925 [Aliidiomarina sanyensis]